MFIQTKCNELSFADLIRATKDTTDESKKFPYKSFVARCGNCQFCYKGKCSLKECCCMGDRVKAGSCSFTELLNHCFRNIGDNVFRFRLRIAAERAAEEHSCFLSKEHFKRFREGCALKRLIFCLSVQVISFQHTGFPTSILSFCNVFSFSWHFVLPF